ncbi:hypothetical protein ACX27_04840 [Nostoc piscinale CENA21]|uniref:Putative restriction endonuclease domain-containing protein n=1 Tax=Nostoc piscinale CENA21 TaxID=224013 RepID=A0A0M3V4Q1_9NOSO|nr:Uma2 family endonuclease [Nostoc piscinale]ALF52327.1 hypothetical protein ACX27_04840 [Nostoc piscinale CENA21]
MVVTPIKNTTSTDYSLEDWLQSPSEGKEWVNGELLEKEVTLKHSRIQAKVATYWRNYKDASGQGGEVYTEAPCLTNKQGRRPDVAYLTPELMQQFGEPAVLPQSFPLIAEIISPTDLAEDMIAKSQEYLQSGSEEVWLVFPENSWIIVITKNQRLVFIAGEIVRTQSVLPGFNIAVNELLG